MPRNFLFGLAAGFAGALVVICATWVICGALVRAFPAGSAEWVSAIGTILAILGAAWIAGRQSRKSDIRDSSRRAARLVHASRVIYVVYDELRHAAINFDVDEKVLFATGAPVGYSTPETVTASMRSVQRSLEDFPAESLDEVEVIRVLYFARALLTGALGDVERLAGLRLPEARLRFQRASAALNDSADELLRRYRPVWPLAEPDMAAAQADMRVEPEGGAQS